MRTSGASSISSTKRPGTEGLAPEASSMTPAARVSAAATGGAAAKAAGFRSRIHRMGSVDVLAGAPTAYSLSSAARQRV
jgi:hypothetical protein